MTVELGTLIAVAGTICGIVFGYTSFQRAEKHNTKTDASELTTVIVKLESIGTGITEIKSEMTNVKNDIKENRERIIKTEESSKQAHKRIDALMEERKER